MKVPFFRAKAKQDHQTIVEGFYFQMPELYGQSEPLRHFLIFEALNDWNMKNKPDIIEIDVDTLEQVNDVEV